MNPTAQQRDGAATHALIVEHLGVVGHVVQEFLARVPAFVERQELVSAGYVALVKAAHSYREDTNVPFRRWAALRVRGAIVDELRSMDWIGRQTRRRSNLINDLKAAFYSEHHRTPSPEELAELMGVPTSAVLDAQAAGDTQVLAMDMEPEKFVNIVIDCHRSPEDQAIHSEEVRYMLAGVAELPERLRYVVEQLFFYDRSTNELAEELDITHSRISQMRTEALGLLRDGMNSCFNPDMVSRPENPGGVAERRRQAYYAALAMKAAASITVSTAQVARAAFSGAATSPESPSTVSAAA